MSESRPPVFICAYAMPELGMEGVAHRVLRTLNEESLVESVAVTGPVWTDVPMLSLGGPVSGPLRLAVIWWRLYRARPLLRDRRVVAVGVWVAIALLMVPRLRARSIVVWEHSLISEKVASSRKLRILQLLASFLYPRADQILCVSDPLAVAVRQATRHPNVSVINNPLDDEPYSEEEVVEVIASRGMRRALTIGSLSRTKNQREAILAVSKLLSLELVILGDGRTRQELVTLCDQLSIRDRVTFLGHVSQSEVQRELREADIVIHPAKGETFGMVYFEAAQAGVPVVAARNAVSSWCIPEYVPGLTYTAGSEELAKAITSALDMDLTEPARLAHSRRVECFEKSRIGAQWRRTLGLTESSDEA